jgi:hypothetical protein
MGGSGFDRRMTRLPAGSVLPYDAAEWEDALVIVVCGHVELESLSGGRWRFGRGAMFWLQGQPVKALHNPTDEVTVLMSVARPAQPRDSAEWKWWISQ